MIFTAELFAAWLAGVASVFVAAAVFGPRLMKWYLRRRLGGMMNLTGYKMRTEADAPSVYFSSAPPE